MVVHRGTRFNTHPSINTSHYYKMHITILRKLILKTESLQFPSY